MQRIQQLNGYLDLLPCLFYLEHAITLTKVVHAFDDADLASHILRMVSRNWQDQYELTDGTVPQSVCRLLKVLECIEKAYPTKKEQQGPEATATGGGSSKKRMVSLVNKSPRSPTKKQSTVHYARSMGACKTPITLGTEEEQLGWYSGKGFTGKNAQRNSRNGSVLHDQKTSYVQLSTKIAKLEMSNKKLKNASKKRKRDYDSDSNDSDTS